MNPLREDPACKPPKGNFFMVGGVVRGAPKIQVQQNVAEPAPVTQAPYPDEKYAPPEKYGVDWQTLQNVKRAHAQRKKEIAHVAEMGGKLGTDGPCGPTPGFTVHTPTTLGIAKVEPCHGWKPEHPLSPYVPEDPFDGEAKLKTDYTPYEG
jgi:hypothetical protein